MCCATNVDGNCQMACVKGISEKRKSGTCPPGTVHRPTGGVNWVHAFCKWARATQATTTPNSCRIDGDCEGAAKCCQALPTAKDILGACERKCVAPAAIDANNAAANGDDAGAQTMPAATEEVAAAAAATAAAAAAAAAEVQMTNSVE